MAQTQLSKDIKKINERIKDFIRKGYTESEQYKTLIRSLTYMGLQTTEIKDGKQLRNLKSYTEEQAKYIHSIVKTGRTVGAVKEKYRKSLGIIQKEGETLKEYRKREDKTIKKEVKKNAKIHDFIQANRDKIYEFDVLKLALKRSSKLTETEREAILNINRKNNNKLRKLNAEYEKMQKRIEQAYGVDNQS